jgi:hypothetical protein
MGRKSGERISYKGVCVLVSVLNEDDALKTANEFISDLPAGMRSIPTAGYTLSAFEDVCRDGDSLEAVADAWLELAEKGHSIAELNLAFERGYKRSA